VRLGLACVSVPVKTGRPTQSSKQKANEQYTKAVASISKNCNGAGPAKQIMRAIIRMAKEDGRRRTSKKKPGTGASQGETTEEKLGSGVIWSSQDECFNAMDMDQEIFANIHAFVVFWVWIAMRRKSANLLSEAMMLAHSFKLPFPHIAVLLTKASTKSIGSNSVNWSYWETVPAKDIADRVPVENLSIVESGEDNKNCGVLLRITYFGRTFFFSTPGFMDNYMSADRANSIWEENKTDVYSQFLTQASLDVIMNQQAKTLFQKERYDYVFDSAVGPVKTFSSQSEFQQLEVINKNKIKEKIYSHINTWLSISGDYYECVFRFTSEKGLKNLAQANKISASVIERNSKASGSRLSRKRSLSPPTSLMTDGGLLLSGLQLPSPLSSSNNLLPNFSEPISEDDMLDFTSIFPDMRGDGGSHFAAENTKNKRRKL
jgi:hypothetical protein